MQNNADLLNSTLNDIVESHIFYVLSRVLFFVGFLLLNLYDRSEDSCVCAAKSLCDEPADTLNARYGGSHTVDSRYLPKIIQQVESLCGWISGNVTLSPRSYALFT